MNILFAGQLAVDHTQPIYTTPATVATFGNAQLNKSVTLHRAIILQY